MPWSSYHLLDSFECLHTINTVNSKIFKTYLSDDMVTGGTALCVMLHPFYILYT